ncbi:MAG: SIS domain-containing protein [Fimbriimonadaceae bacterium]
METEISEQPEVLARNSERYLSELKQYLQGKSFDLILLAARGSSDHAALYARYLIEIHLGIPVTLAAPSVITQHKSKIRFPKCLAVGISQSGAAPDVSEVIAYLRDQGHDTLAITNTANSRLGQSAHHTLLLEAGSENSIAATKTYSASLLAVAQMVQALGADFGVAQLPKLDWLETTHALASENSGHIVRCNPIFSLGRVYIYCTAVETALKLMECALIPAKSYSIADFHHGPKALASHGTACILYGDVPEDLRATGATVIEAPQAHQGIWEPLWNIQFGQWLALLAARARGIDPDIAQNLKKVTETL